MGRVVARLHCMSGGLTLCAMTHETKEVLRGLKTRSCCHKGGREFVGHTRTHVDVVGGRVFLASWRIRVLVYMDLEGVWAHNT